MTGEECFDLWTPSDSAWSDWAKPSLFAQMGQLSYQRPADAARPDSFDAFWVREADGRTAVVVDVPGAASVACGLALARRGYRPVPSYNTSLGPSPVVDAESIARELAIGAETLRGLTIRHDAPPAFLIDSERMTPAVPAGPGKFDNRWVVFPQDFPSGARLHGSGVRGVLLLHGDRGLLEDLAHVLLRWQEIGIGIQAADWRDAGSMRELRVQPPSMFRRAWYRALTIARLRRNNVGGFGAVIPLPSSGGGYG